MGATKNCPSLPGGAGGGWVGGWKNDIKKYAGANMNEKISTKNGRGRNLHDKVMIIEKGERNIL